MQIKDLSKRYSATSAFIEILPKIEALLTVNNMLEYDKLELAVNTIINKLKQVRQLHPRSISAQYIRTYKERLYSCRSIEDIITMLKKSIACGKNYIEGEK